MSKKIFITGVLKTATSSMVAALNMHPNVYIGYELFDNERSRKQLIEVMPKVKNIFDKHGHSKESLYPSLELFLTKSGYSYRYFGDKIAVCRDAVNIKTLNDLDKLGDYIIFMIRDLQYWTAKMVRMDKTIRYFSTTTNIAEMICKYMTYFLSSYKFDLLRVDVDEFLDGNWIPRVSEYIGEPFEKYIGAWWKVGYKKGDPKSMNWKKKHPSSTVKPGKKDTKFITSDHEIWHEILPIFNKYHKNLDNSFGTKEIDNDIISVKRITDKYNNLRPAGLFSSLKCFDIEKNKLTLKVI